MAWMAKCNSFAFVLYLHALFSMGCATERAWNSPRVAAPTNRHVSEFANASSPIDLAEANYAKAAALERQSSEACVRAYADTAQLCWTAMADANFPVDKPVRAVELYQSAVAKLVTSAQQFECLDPTMGICLATTTSESERCLPIRFTGMNWEPSELVRFDVVGDYKPLKHIRSHVQKGLGVPVLSQVRSGRQFTHPESTTVATAAIRPSDDSSQEFVLDIINTLSIRETQVGSQLVPLAVDLTATIAFLNSQADRHGINGLLRPEALESATGLKMIEPYQPGKIPVIFIHGLASDPLTWGSLANDIFMHRDILNAFQFWTFSYPTGKPFPVEAANLRKQLLELRNHIDPDHADPALDDIVLIGHSMGGLVSKMQISSSRNELLAAMFTVPLDQLELDVNAKGQFTSLFQFTPSTQVTRTVFIGTPHQGSNLAKGFATQLVSKAIRQPSDLERVFDELLEANKRFLTTKKRRMPTSIDLLRPDDPLLQAIYRLPVNPGVKMHSIYGVGHKGRFGKESGDGIVPSSSARHPNVQSELAVDAGHGLHNHPDTTDEVVRILRLHLAAAGVASKPAANKAQNNF